MMAAVHFAGVVGQPLAHQRRQQRVLLDPDFVREACRPDSAAPAGCAPSAPGSCGRDVLHQRAAAGDVQHLHAAADREDRQLARARAAVISAISNSSRPGSASTVAGCAALAVARRRHVVAAGQQQPVDAGHRLVERHRRIEQPRLAADVEDRLPVVLDLRGTL